MARTGQNLSQEPGAAQEAGKERPALYDRIRAPSAYQLVARQIERQILTGRLQPGDEVGTEAELVRQFGVNRSTVREGIRLLEQSGFVRRESGRRLFVSAPQFHSLNSRMSRAMIMESVTFDEIFETSLLLEIGAVRAAAQRATAEDIAALRANIARAEASRGEPERIAALDAEFHRLVAHASGNRVLELAREPAALLFFPTTAEVCRLVPEGTGRMLEAHRLICDAIEAGDEEAGALWMRRHVTDWLRGFKRTGRDPSQPVQFEARHEDWPEGLD